MEKDALTSTLKAKFKHILGIDQDIQKAAIEEIYDIDCHLENPYLVFMY